MINLSNLKTLIANKPVNPTTDDFIKIHKGVEGYFRRLIFIGLRINGVKYQKCQEVIALSYLTNRPLVTKAIDLITGHKKTISDFEKSNQDFKVFLNLFFTFTSVYRNRIVHGVDEKIYDQTILKYCYYIDNYLIDEFEDTFKKLRFPSAFDCPRDWSAKRVIKNESLNSVVTRLKLGSIVPPPQGITSIINQVSKTKYRGRI